MGSRIGIGFWFVFAMALFVVALSPAIFLRVAAVPYIYTDALDIPDAAAVLVPGASVVRGHQSPVLAARTETAKMLYERGKVRVILLTGSVEGKYDEVTPMRAYLIDKGIPAGDIAVDSAGVDTFQSMYRARNIFLADSLIIVTQDFHLPRAVFLARALHIRAYGLVAPRGGRLFDYLREIPASWKALWDVLTYRPEGLSALAPLIISGVAAR